MRRQTNTLLLVNEDPDELQLLERAFKAAGVSCQIRAVRDADEAVAYMSGEGEFARKDHFPFPSFIVTGLEKRSGRRFALLERTAEHPEWCIVPIAILTNSEEPADIQKGYALGAKSYIVKPKSMHELQALARVFFDYWSLCEVPQMDNNGKLLPVEDSEKETVQEHVRQHA